MKKIMYNEKKANHIIKTFTENNSKGFWSEIKTILIRKPPKYNNDSEILPSQWFSHFRDLLNAGHDNETLFEELDETESRTDGEECDLLNGPILYNEVVTAINNLKNGKAAGFD